MDNEIMNILHLTSILSAPISTKTRENDILLRLAQEYEKKYPNSKHHFFYLTPYANWFVALLRKKWKEYYHIIKKGSFECDGYNVTVIGVPGFKYDTMCRKTLAWFGYKLFERRICQALQQAKPDIIHAHNMGSNTELAHIIQKKHGIKYVVSARKINKLTLKHIRSKRLTPSGILAYSMATKNKCKNLDVPLHVIPHPVDDVFFSHERSSESKDSQILRLVTVCNLIRRKNLDQVIGSLQNVKIEFSFTIYGDGPVKQDLMDLVKEKGLQKKVLFKGYIPYSHLSKTLKQYDLFVLPSHNETLGRVYFEAMASGLPVIASRNTGIDGMIEHKREGYLVDHNNMNEIQEAIQHYMSLPSKQKLMMKRNALAFAKQFTWDTVLEKYQTFYHSCLK
jgi:glycosyltransferase involved in cell wall biosynthesis